MDNGFICFEVFEKNDVYICCCVFIFGEFKFKCYINFFGVKVNFLLFIEKDCVDIFVGIEEGIDFVVFFFVCEVKDIEGFCEFFIVNYFKV